MRTSPLSLHRQTNQVKQFNHHGETSLSYVDRTYPVIGRFSAQFFSSSNNWPSQQQQQQQQHICNHICYHRYLTWPDVFYLARSITCSTLFGLSFLKLQPACFASTCLQLLPTFFPSFALSPSFSSSSCSSS